MDTIKVLELRAVQGGNLKALATVRLGEIVVHDFRVIQQPGQRAYVGAPAVFWETEDGKRNYKQLVELPQSLKAEIEKEVLKAYQVGKYSKDDAWERQLQLFALN